jgi:predicted Zn-dependent protease
MATIREWRIEIERLDADEINDLIESFNKLEAWAIFGREYGEVGQIVKMLKAREDFLAEQANEQQVIKAAALAKRAQETLEEAQCLACSYRVEGACPLTVIE